MPQSNRNQATRTLLAFGLAAATLFGCSSKPKSQPSLLSPSAKQALVCAETTMDPSRTAKWNASGSAYQVKQNGNWGLFVSHDKNKPNGEQIEIYLPSDNTPPSTVRFRSYEGKENETFLAYPSRQYYSSATNRAAGKEKVDRLARQYWACAKSPTPSPK